MMAALERGRFGFQQIPSPGDHIEILNERGLMDLLKVAYVQHTPAHSLGGLKIEQPITHIICDIEGTDIPLPR
jgi:hypothetical protein